MSKNVNTGKLRFGVLDAVIIIIVVALAVALVFRFTTDMRLFTYETEKYSVTVRISGLNHTTVDMISDSDAVYFEDGTYLGSFMFSPTVTPMVIYELGSEGDLIPAYYPDNTLVDITNIIECELVTSNGMLMTKSGVHLAAGVELKLHTQTVDIDVEIVNVEKIQP